MKLWQRYLAEVFGTFVLVFGGTTAIVGAIRTDQPVLLVVPFAFGLALLGGLYAFAEVSGGHFNPAVSLADVPRRAASEASELIGYWIAQFSGAILASLLLSAGDVASRRRRDRDRAVVERDSDRDGDRLHGDLRPLHPAGVAQRDVRRHRARRDPAHALDDPVSRRSRSAARRSTRRARSARPSWATPGPACGSTSSPRPSARSSPGSCTRSSSRATRAWARSVAWRRRGDRPA